MDLARAKGSAKRGGDQIVERQVRFANPSSDWAGHAIVTSWVEMRRHPHVNPTGPAQP